MTRSGLRAWFDDPDRFWQRMAVICFLIAVISAALAAKMYGNNGRLLAQVVGLSEVNETQRKAIYRIDQELDQVRRQMTALKERLVSVDSQQKPLTPEHSDPAGKSVELERAADSQEDQADPSVNEPGEVDFDDLTAFVWEWLKVKVEEPRHRPTGDRLGP